MQTIIVAIPKGEKVRINQYLSSAGVVSRRQADSLIASGSIAINGKHAALGTKVVTGDRITFLTKKPDLRYFLYYKPRGQVTGVLPSHADLHPVGRLDKESEGLLLYTNDYRITEALLSPNNKHPKKYVVQVKEAVLPRVKRIIERGLYTDQDTYAPAKVFLRPEEKTIEITLTEGKKHEIRRMLNALQLTVARLVRVQLLFLTTKALQPGILRPLTTKEKEDLLRILKLTK